MANQIKSLHCEEWREQCLSEKSSLTFETVFSSAGKVEFVRKALNAGYFVMIFFISTENPTINTATLIPLKKGQIGKIYTYNIGELAKNTLPKTKN